MNICPQYILKREKGRAVMKKKTWIFAMAPVAARLAGCGSAAAAGKEVTATMSAPAHVHNWKPVNSKRLVKDAWTEEVTKTYTTHERHEISKYKDANGNTIDLTRLYNEWYASGVWKNYPKIDEDTQIDIDAGYLNPDLIPELGSYAWFCNYLPLNAVPLETPSNWSGPSDWWFCVTTARYSADVPVEKTATETVTHPAVYEDYVSGYICSCGATK